VLGGSNKDGAAVLVGRVVGVGGIGVTVGGASVGVGGTGVSVGGIEVAVGGIGVDVGATEVGDNWDVVHDAESSTTTAR
jgi:hypothetical protein